MTPAQTPRAREFRLLDRVGLFALIWAAAQSIAVILPCIQILAYLLNGAAFGVYAGILYAVRGGVLNTVRASVVALLGVTHIAWLEPASKFAALATGPLNLPFSIDMYVATSGVLGVVITVLSWRWWMIIPPIISLGVILGVMWIGHNVFLSLWPLAVLSLGLCVSLVHVGLLISVWTDTYLHLRAKWPLYGCAHCGYDVRNLTSPMCPECGKHPTSADGGWTHD